MRQTLLALLAAAAYVSATGSTCTSADLKKVVSRQCGCDHTVLSCLSLTPNSEGLEGIQRCYVKGGCEKEAAIEAASHLVRECKANAELIREDLKKRQEGPTTSEATQTLIPTSTAIETLTSPAITTALANNALTCSTTTLKPTTLCSRTGNVRTCIPTQTPISFCKPENVCFKTSKNEDSCKLRDNTVAPMGIALIVIVPTIIAIIVISLVVMRFRDKKARPRALALRKAEGGGLESNVRYERFRGKPGTPDGVPLIEIQPPPAYTENENGGEFQAR